MHVLDPRNASSTHLPRSEQLTNVHPRSSPTKHLKNIPAVPASASRGPGLCGFQTRPECAFVRLGALNKVTDLAELHGCGHFVYPLDIDSRIFRFFFETIASKTRSRVCPVCTSRGPDKNLPQT
jgi:hypothetical protein